MMSDIMLDMKREIDFKLLPVLLVIFGILLRLLPHKVNFAPIGAIALFAGVYLPKRWNFIIPLIVILITDYFLKYYGLLMLFTYGTYILMTLLGQIYKKYRIDMPIVGSILFFIVSNFGFWVVFKGSLINTYIMAIPFFKATLVSDFLYTSGLFLAYEIIKYVVKAVKRNNTVVSWLV
jgi:hypothetical protein